MPPRRPADEERLSPSIIDSAPIEPDLPQDERAEFFLEIAQLATENEQLKAENEQLKAKKTFEEVRAELMEPYANRVFYFLLGYCAFVGALLLLQGFHVFSFNLSDMVLAIVAGSTAASVVGLVGFVVNGLFKSRAS